MAIFLTDEERKLLTSDCNAERNYSNLYWGLLNRVRRHSTEPGFGVGSNSRYWHNAAEYLGDAAFIAALTSDTGILLSWVRSSALALADLPLSEWIGPEFRDHASQPPCGNLETAHLATALALVYDLLPGAFTAEELAKLRKVLSERAIPLCRQFFRTSARLNNWHAVMLSGLAMPAAVLGDRDAMREAADTYRFLLDIVQPDGSYGESLQYGNYCFRGLMLSFEALTRSDPALKLDMRPYARSMRWIVQSYLYNKPLSGWGSYPRPRSLNFNDSAALFGADPDLLMHISFHAKKSLPLEAGLARHLFDELYTDYPAQGPFDRSSFGFLNRYGFLTLLYYRRAAESRRPDELPLVEAFSNGHLIARSSHSADATVLGFSAGSTALHAVAHLHGDLNSVILAFRKERMLVDPGHCCYRSALYALACDTANHNSCIFRTADNRVLTQKPCPGRAVSHSEKTIAPPPRRPGKLLISGQFGEVVVFGNDAAEAYGGELRSFERFTILAGSHIVFIVDRIEGDEPVATCWNWLFNNRDGELELKLFPDRLVARRGGVGMKLFHLGNRTRIAGPFSRHVHDAYHPLPDMPGEGADGSGTLVSWSEESVQSAPRTVIHAIVLDDYGPVAAWHLKELDGAWCVENRTESWSISTTDNSLVISNNQTGCTEAFHRNEDGSWTQNERA